jgi:vitamin B12 transporter
MNRTTIAGLLSLLFTTPIATSVSAAENIHLDELIVTASRTEESRHNVVADVSVITRDEIERAGQSTLVELLQLQPGIEINNNGGPGKTSGIFIRGTNTNHVIVLVDGVRLNSATAGTTTFENLPVALIEKIEILRGPATALYGQDAIGGVIQIFTRKGKSEPRFYAGAGYGTYDTKTAEAGVHGAIADTSFAIGVSSYDTDGFSALKTNNPNLNDDDGYRNLSFTGSVSHRIAEGHELGLQLLHSEGHVRFDNRFNIDPFFPAFNPAFSDNAEITQHSYAVTSKNQITSSWMSTLRAGEGADESVTYAALGPFTTESRSLFKTKQRQYSWQNDITLPLGTLTLLYDRLEERVKSTTDFKQSDRNNDGYFIGYLLNHGPHTVQLNYRSDHNSVFGTNETEGLGYGYRLNEHWRVTASYGTAFKAPSFNDLFFPDFWGTPSSNPDLNPEKARNIEASLRYSDDRSNASLTLYENKIRNLIALDANFIPENINDARVQGMTLAGSHTWNNWQFGGNIDVLSPRDRETDDLLVRRANRHASLNTSYTWGDWRFGAEAIASSARYNDAANTQRLAGYSIFNLTTDYAISKEWQLKARLNNLFDKDYALAYDGDPRADGLVYNTPGSNLFVSIRYQTAP